MTMLQTPSQTKQTTLWGPECLIRRRDSNSSAGPYHSVARLNQNRSILIALKQQRIEALADTPAETQPHPEADRASVWT